ncbi:hypothetical protein [Paremcibacter congregatus]|uniref:Uncharacterized protein n=1 Tax=Paremcibacter congregatus TaxID=2043170 RepID=A0A2G4YQZ1_9PROT|nr:hypothetical protein [Paremcibacter congregatus]PHZ84690.1 hypothetical protein CRD36_10400 [Paremcibacter congregatus]QDE28884.1 hypothetical protein FIV45_17165 [Paremcibacter congregatus]|tara:strand:+ start:176 stop:448 length:273 start_codon:yes stop_codon:yes gene_type:complete
MKVVSKLANMNLTVGRMYREGNRLVITNEGGEGIPTKVYVHPRDVVGALKAFFKSLSAILFILLFPWFYIRGLRDREEKVTPKSMNNPWV